MKKFLVLALAAFALLSCGGSGSGNPNAKNGALLGKFSISPYVQVQFSQGNLQYQPSTKTWRFAQNQFDTIGVSNALIAEEYEGWIDLFGWSTANNPTMTSTNNQHYPDFIDWGTNSISNGGKDNQWRTLTYNEWTYLFAHRTDAKDKYGVGEVNGIEGLIILPDEWELPDGLTFRKGMARDLGSKAASINCYTLEQWNEMEKNGAVFLPQAGNRNGSKVEPEYGSYWTATAYNYAQAYNIFISPIGFTYRSWGGRHYGHSVRLAKVITDVQADEIIEIEGEEGDFD